MVNKNKIIKVIYVVALVVVLVLSFTFGVSARSNNDVTADFINPDGSYTQIIKASNEYDITFKGTLNGVSELPEQYVYVSRDIMSGYIEQDSTDARYYIYDYNHDTDRISNITQGFDGNNNLQNLSDLVSRPIYARWETLNQSGAVNWNMSYVGSGGTVVDEVHKVANLRYVDSVYLKALYNPDGVVLHSDSVYWGGSMTTLLEDGYQGIEMFYLYSSEFLNDAPYVFTCDVISTNGHVGSVRVDGYISRNDGRYRCPLIPYDAYDDIRYAGDGGTFFKLENVCMNVNFTSMTTGVPTTSTDRSFTFLVYQDIVAGDGGTGQKNGFSVYDDYDFTMNYFYYERGYVSGGGGYQAGYNDGYSVGKNDGYQAGYDDGSEKVYNEISPLDFVVKPVESILNMHIFGNVTLGGVLGVVLGICLLVLFLRYFAGG